MLALVGMFLTIWANLAVGIVGSEGNPANMGFFAALLVGIAGSAIARFRANGMAIAMGATAASMAIAFAIAVMGPTDEPNVSHWLELGGTSGFRRVVPRIGRPVPQSGADQSSSTCSIFGTPTAHQSAPNAATAAVRTNALS